MPLRCEAVHNSDRTEEDDRLACRRICEIYREFHEREAARKAGTQNGSAEGTENKKSVPRKAH